MTQVVLVVEDNAVTRKVVNLALTGEGFAVLEAATGAECLEVAARAHPDLVLQDLQLPDIDGIELIGQLRALPSMHGVPVVAFSGFLSRLEYGRATALGFTDFVPKPIEPARLVEAIRSHLPAAEPADPQIGAGRRVLIADDDPVQLKIGRLRLRALGFAVETAGNGFEALSILRRTPVDAVVSDVLMPGMDGYRLCAEIRSDPALSHLPVVLASSSYVEQADQMHAHRMGATGFAVRTPDLGAVLAELASALSAPRPGPCPITAEVVAEQRDRAVQQLERQAAMNTAFAHRATMQASMLSVVAGMSEALSRHCGLGDSLSETLAILLDASGVSHGALYTYAGRSSQLALDAVIGFSEQARAGLEGFIAQVALIESVIAAKEPRLISVGLANVDERALLAALQVSCVLLVPFTNGGDCLGLLLFGCLDQALAGPDWAAFSRMIAVQLGQGLVLARAVRRLAASERFARALIDQASDSVMQQARDAGCDRLLLMPCLPDALAFEIHDMLASRRHDLS